MSHFKIISFFIKLPYKKNPFHIWCQQCKTDFLVWAFWIVTYATKNQKVKLNSPSEGADSKSKVTTCIFIWKNTHLLTQLMWTNYFLFYSVYIMAFSGNTLWGSPINFSVFLNCKNLVSHFVGYLQTCTTRSLWQVRGRMVHLHPSLQLLQMNEMFMW